MKRRSFILTSVITGLSASSIFASNAPKTTPVKNEETDDNQYIVHSVYFWLKPGISKEDELEFLKYFELLKKIPGLKSLTFGKAAKTTVRPVTDNTFDYNLIVTFDNLEAIKKYETHPDHLKGSKAFEKYWEKVQVRDTYVSK